MTPVQVQLKYPTSGCAGMGCCLLPSQRFDGIRMEEEDNLLSGVQSVYQFS
jgi:hypothetical protein